MKKQNLQNTSPLPLFPVPIREFSADIYLLKVNNKNTRKRCEICSNLTIKTPERRQCDVALVSLLLTLNIFHILFYCFYC